MRRTWVILLQRKLCCSEGHLDLGRHSGNPRAGWEGGAGREPGALERWSGGGQASRARVDSSVQGGGRLRAGDRVSVQGENATILAGPLPQNPSRKG